MAFRLSFRRHATAYFLAVVVFVPVSILADLGIAFWPLSAWGVALALHFFYDRSVNVDEEWVEERADEMRLRSYDLSHIQNIEERVASADQSVQTPEQREGGPS